MSESHSEASRFKNINCLIASNNIRSKNESPILSFGRNNIANKWLKIVFTIKASKLINNNKI